MYRVINMMCFGDGAIKIHKACLPGTVVAIISPKFMAAKPGLNEEQYISFSIDSDS